jgi:uncharacterized protein (UPF0335 family)
MNMNDIIAADQYRLFIERIERLEGEVKSLAKNIRDINSNHARTKQLLAFHRLF